MDLHTKLLEELHKHFGYDSFKQGQEEIIMNLINGKDVLGILPTGVGKSLCYQLYGYATKSRIFDCFSADILDAGSGCKFAFSRRKKGDCH